ncbi:MAG: sigma-70 family RNA polymerase sigma factor [Polyangiaceae bacterium]|nr:sigma-70 family RNA polymerase sigma factor [Polyangiaceae bacterium]
MRAESPTDKDLQPNRVNTTSMAASNKQQRRAEAEEDRALIEAAQRGDERAFRSLVERHQRRVFAIAVAIVRDENDAREIAQEAFLRVHKGLDRFQGGSSFFTWLYRIVTNLSIDLVRRPMRREAELVDERLYEITDDTFAPMLSHVDGADPVQVVRRKEIAGRLREALEALPPYHQGVILMREVEGMSYEEMAQAMGVSKGTIMSRLFHARQKLQRALRDCYEEETGMPAGDVPSQPPKHEDDP